MHFLRENERYGSSELGRPWAAVRVKLDGARLHIVDDGEGALVIAKMDAIFAPLPERIVVVGPDGKIVKPSKRSRFWVTLESIDPYHLVTDAADLPLPEIRRKK